MTTGKAARSQSNKRTRNSSGYQDVRGSRTHPTRINRGVSRSKIEKVLALKNDTFIAKHVPETDWYDIKSFWRLLDIYSVVYVKPDRGVQGNDIFRVKRKSDNEYEIASVDTAKIVSRKALDAELQKAMANRSYIVQQGIDLATYKACPFDIRVVMQKPSTYWQLTLTSAKVALREEAVVTNVAKGAKDYYLNDILRSYDQRQDPLATLRELADLSHQIASLLGVKFPLRIIGLDMAIDKHGKIWYIEANTRPQCEQCKLVNDKLSLYKFDEAMKILKG